jgi:hypothetical protein
MENTMLGVDTTLSIMRRKISIPTGSASYAID